MVIDLVYYHEKSVDEAADILRENSHVLCSQEIGGNGRAGVLWGGARKPRLNRRGLPAF